MFKMKRIINIDFLRAIVLILALIEHASYYINTWFINYQDYQGYGILLNAITKYANTYIIPDNGIFFMYKYFVVWVSQIYIALACFNIGIKHNDEIKVKLKNYIKKYILFFIFFLFEGFLIGINLGEAITIHPLILWIGILILFYIIYGMFNIQGMVSLFIFLNILAFIISDLKLSGYFENLIIDHIHQGFSYDSRFEYFINSAFLGFFLGYLQKKQTKTIYLVLIPLALIIITSLLGFDSFNHFDYSVDHMFRNESLFYQKAGNLFYIYSIISSLIILMLEFEKRKIKFNFKVTNYISKNSITIFALHKILLVKIIIPLYILIFVITKYTIINTLFLVFLIAILIIYMVYFLQKTNFFKSIFNYQ